MGLSSYNISQNIEPKNKKLNKILIIYVILFGFLFIMQKQLWYGYGNIKSNLLLKSKIENQLKINNNKILENNKLNEKIQAFKSESNGLIGQARYDLGMIKKGEEYFEFKRG
tara:strand:+ start:503 stop:838 length:336 start_codon:yes stop_codon:yes gene_type:complete